MGTLYIVYKTHLDVGFTNYAEPVMQNYFHNFIPNAIKVANAVNGTEKQFVWTTGSYLIDQFLKTQDEEAVQELEEAIKKGYLTYHALPFTTHTELMNKELFEYGLSITKRLDERFGLQTVAAKMTDVPGHTKAIVPSLAKYGIKFLHIGVNGASAVPEVPAVFRWKVGNDEVVVAYSYGYGSLIEIPGYPDKLLIEHTLDNHGPQGKEDIEAKIGELKKTYPNMEMKASSMDEFAEKLWEHREILPIVTEEIGDTWIHGVMSDPKKVQLFREMLKHTEQNDAYYDALLAIPEHTWGLDNKSHLHDKHYRKSEFEQARKKTNKDNYAFYEGSWQEQRDYLKKAKESLPKAEQQKLDQAFASLLPQKAQPFDKLLEPEQVYEIGGLEVAFNSQGAVSFLNLDGKLLADETHELGRFVYEAVGEEDYNEWCVNYIRDYEIHHGWAFPDFCKDGMQYLPEYQRTKTFAPYLKTITRGNDAVLITLGMPEDAKTVYGAPSDLQIKYDFGNREIRVEFSFFGKTAVRSSEALWLKFNPLVKTPSMWRMKKLGVCVNPSEVVSKGNRLMHCTDELSYTGSDLCISIESVDTPLVALGDTRLLQFKNELPRLENGFYYNLFNNIWGTNFRMWFEEDMMYRFVIKF